MILAKKNFDKNSILFTNLIFAFFPISFILGNLITNINLLLFCCFGIFHLKSKILSIKYDLIIKIIFWFFIIVFFSTVLSFLKSLYFDEYEHINFVRLIKSALFFRFLLLLLIVYLLSEENIINFRYFFISASFLPFVISIDVIFQYIFGFNVIGLKSYVHHNTSFFGDELISGGFIQNFSFFSILFLSYLLRNHKDYIKFFLVIIAICILATGIIFSGNRMPVILFLLGLFLVYIFNTKLRKVILVSFIALLTTFSFIIKTDSFIKVSYQSFYENVRGIVIFASNKLTRDKSKIILDEKMIQLAEKHDTPERAGYRNLIFTAFETWKSHKIFGNGIKSFREDCKKLMIKKRGTCSNHPHNYYLEILTDLGVVGFIFVLAMGFIFIAFLIKNFVFLNKNKLENLFLLAAIISLILEVFPIKSSGSIFTTNNTTYIIIISSIVLSRKKLLEGKNFK